MSLFDDHYPVTWVLAKLKRTKFWLGFCGKTRHAALIATTALEPMVVQDIIVEPDQCEEGSRCVYFACPLNRADRHRVFGKKTKQPANPSIGESTFDEFFGDREVEGGVMTTQKGGWLIEFTPGGKQ